MDRHARTTVDHDDAHADHDEDRPTEDRSVHIVDQVIALFAIIQGTLLLIYLLYRLFR
jgi:hypothetical protein